MALVVPAVAQPQKNEQNKGDLEIKQPVVIVRQGSFYVGGRYVTSPGQIMTGQMYVRYQIPKNGKHGYPIIMIHGGGTPGTIWEETPDGR